MPAKRGGREYRQLEAGAVDPFSVSSNNTDQRRSLNELRGHNARDIIQ
jgi:hypothetical protein